MESSRWWLTHAAVPALLAATLFVALQLGGDRLLAGTLYDPAGQGWLLDPGLAQSRFLYGGERALIFGAVLAGLGLLLAGCWFPGIRDWRRPIAFVLLSLGATTALVGAAKQATNVDCPRALVEYGGPRRFVGLFEDRPDDWPRAACFPAGHSSAAFAFVSLYFVLAAARPRWRWAGLGAGLGFGLAFGATQWARGMHFPSHDVVSAAVAWAVALATNAALYRAPDAA